MLRDRNENFQDLSLMNISENCTDDDLNALLNAGRDLKVSRTSDALEQEAVELAEFEASE